MLRFPVLLLLIATAVLATPTLDRTRLQPEVLPRAKTATLDPNRLHKAPVRQQLVEAAHAQDAEHVATCLLQIDFDDRELLAKANRCVCEFPNELKNLHRIPRRAEGLATACREGTPLPAINIFDTVLKLQKLCGTEGLKNRWAFCSLF